MSDTYNTEKEARLRECKRALSRFAFLQSISAKDITQMQKRQMDEDRETIRERFEEFFELLTESEFSEIRFDFAEHDGDPSSLGTLNALLNDPSARCPRFPTELSLNVMGHLLIDINRAETLVRGHYEQLEPAYRKWLEFEKRAQLLLKGICMFDKEWQGDALFQVLVPKDVYKRVRHLGECVGKYKLRIETLHGAYEAVSRMITVYTEGQTSDFRPDPTIRRQPASGQERPRVSERPQTRSEEPHQPSFGKGGRGWKSRKAKPD